MARAARAKKGTAGHADVFNVFVDTSVHVAATFSYHRGAFARLRALVEAGLVRVVSTPIDHQEIRVHLREHAAALRASLRKFQTKADALRGAGSDLSQLMHPATTEDIDSVLVKGYDDFTGAVSSIVLPLDTANVDAVFEGYFAHRPPFGPGEKRKEFPDAFIVSTLAGWCRSEQQEVYVVSADVGMRAAAAATDGLTPVDGLSEFLAIVMSTEHATTAMAVVEWISHNRDVVTERIRRDFENAGFFLEEVDGDVEDAVLVDDGVKFARPLLIDADQSQLTVVLPVRLDFECDIMFNDPDTATYDSEDKTLFYHHKRHYRVLEFLETEAEITFVVLTRGEEGASVQGSSWSLELERFQLHGGRDIAVSPHAEVIESYPESSEDDWPESE